MKYVSNSTWARLKEEAAVHFYDELHPDARGISAAALDTETSPIECNAPWIPNHCPALLEGRELQ
ncbi:MULTISPECIES: hypothetical protein [unclassified Cryobacterium]|uniref:hypothetical protein n=1 Tax=unclassified Cryobacterium TaxID=2649013 RepID=UPI0011B09E6B|nr:MULTISPECIES: hypothetical protein [unclassified Cryobacterium]